MIEDGFLSREEEEAVIEAVRAGGGGKVRETDLEAALQWAVRTRVAASILDLVVEKRLMIRGLRKGEPVFVALRQNA